MRDQDIGFILMMERLALEEYRRLALRAIKEAEAELGDWHAREKGG